MKKTRANILIIDDQEDILFSAKMLLKRHFAQVETLSHPQPMVKYLSENEVDVILLDMNYRIGYEDGREGLYLMKEIKKFSPQSVIVLMTAFGKVETAVEGMKSGAFDYILKPWDNEKLLTTVKSAVKEARKFKKETSTTKEKFPYFIGESPSVKKVYNLADKVAKTDANVLILGENGTGKYVMASYIHQHSLRAENDFVHVDLGALNAQLFESELFGYAKGAFTDAKTDTAGRFESANGGTLFLDEIANVPLHLQSKLLQVLQSKSVIRLGESKARPLDVRIITATNRNLSEEVKKGNFREDLYYRINTMEILLPPLRERAGDKLPLALFLLQKMENKYERNALKFSDEALEIIKNYAWNGNIREMENRIERAVILCENQMVSDKDLDIDAKDVSDNNEHNALTDMEKILIEKSLIEHRNNISKTATALGLSRASLYRRIEKYDIKIQ